MSRESLLWKFESVPFYFQYWLREKAEAIHRPDYVEPARGAGMGAYNADKTHCPQGHPYTPENTYYFVSQKGKFRRSRICRTCNKEYQKKRNKTYRRPT